MSIIGPKAGSDSLPHGLWTGLFLAGGPCCTMYTALYNLQCSGKHFIGLYKILVSALNKFIHVVCDVN